MYLSYHITQENYNLFFLILNNDQARTLLLICLLIREKTNNILALHLASFLESINTSLHSPDWC